MKLKTYNKKTKFNKSKCAKCCYHSESIQSYMSCNYALVKGSTCLQKQADGSIIDIRGSEYNNCKCFLAGESKVSTDYRFSTKYYIYPERDKDDS